MKTAEIYLAAGDPVEIFKVMRTDFDSELEMIGKARPMAEYANMIVALVRKYNRTWNEIAKKAQGARVDGFKLCMKKALSGTDMPEVMRRAAAYL